jgi:hypothetical protein
MINNGTIEGMLTSVLISDFQDDNGKTVNYAKINILFDGSETIMAVGIDTKLANDLFGTDDKMKAWKNQDVVVSGAWRFFFNRESKSGEWKFKASGITIKK